jgi:MFS family permease
MSQEAMLSWGWRVPFIASILLIGIGLWVRLSITETPAFQKAIDKEERVAVPVVELFRNHKRSLFLGTFVALATFVLFYIGSAYLLSYNVKVLGIPFLDALEVQLLGSVVFGIFIPIVGKLAERYGRREMLILTTVLIGLFSFFLPVLMTSGESVIFLFVVLAMVLMGMTYGLIGTALAAPFPTSVRYTGSSITFNLAGIFGASLAPYIATWLQVNYGMTYVGYYLGISAVITLACILASRKDEV